MPLLTGVKAAPDMDWRWDFVHNLSSDFVLMLSGFHLAMNWDWILAAAERLFQRALREGL